MASNIDNVELLTWFTSCMTAIGFTQASGTSTTNTQMATSVASQKSADTGLTAQEKAMITTISSGIGLTTPSSAIHGGTGTL